MKVCYDEYVICNKKRIQNLNLQERTVVPCRYISVYSQHQFESSPLGRNTWEEISEIVEKMTSATFFESFSSAFEWHRRDLRSDPWPLTASIWPTLTLSIAYVVLVKVVGPRVMSGSPGMTLRTPMSVYNLVQVVGNLWLLYRYLRHGWFFKYSWGEGSYLWYLKSYVICI